MWQVMSGDSEKGPATMKDLQALAMPVGGGAFFRGSTEVSASYSTVRQQCRGPASAVEHRYLPVGAAGTQSTSAGTLSYSRGGSGDTGKPRVQQSRSTHACGLDHGTHPPGRTASAVSSKVVPSHRGVDVASLWQDFLDQACGIPGGHELLPKYPPAADDMEGKDPTSHGSQVAASTMLTLTEDVPVVQRFELAPTVSPAVYSSGRKAFQRKHLADYMQSQKSREERKTHIPTNANGDITALKSVFHRAVRDIAGRVLDLSIVNFNDHPSICLNYIHHDLSKQFVFNPPLRENYVAEYLKESISNSRYRWRCYWKRQNRRHPNCPVKRYPQLVKYWETPEAEEESRRMRRARTHRTQSTSSHSSTGKLPMSGGGGVLRLGAGRVGFIPDPLLSFYNAVFYRFYSGRGWMELGKRDMSFSAMG
jgi:hypothetical protein